MLQARRNAIVYDHDGAQIRVFGGSQRGRRSFVHETSSVARKYPFLFEPAPDAGHAARSADHVRVTDGGAALKPISPSGGTGMSRAPTVDDPPAEAWLPERWRILPSASDCIRSERRSLTGVRLSAIARRQMRAIVEDQPTVESGGIGWGHSRSSLVEVLAATPPGPKSVHGPRRFRPDVLHDLSMVDQMSKQGLRPVCLFHSHVLYGESIASVADLHFWSSWRRALRMDQLMGPIAAATRRRARRPLNHGWSSPSTSAARCCSSSAATQIFALIGQGASAGSARSGTPAIYSTIPAEQGCAPAGPAIQPGSRMSSGPGCPHGPGREHLVS